MVPVLLNLTHWVSKQRIFSYVLSRLACLWTILKVVSLSDTDVVTNPAKWCKKKKDKTPKSHCQRGKRCQRGTSVMGRTSPSYRRSGRRLLLFAQNFFWSEHTVLPLCHHMTLFDCADVVKWIHLALDRDKKDAYFETASMSGVTCALLRCLVHRSSVDPLLIIWFSSPTHSAPRGCHEEHTLGEGAHTHKKKCVCRILSLVVW